MAVTVDQNTMVLVLVFGGACTGSLEALTLNLNLNWVFEKEEGMGLTKGRFLRRWWFWRGEKVGGILMEFGGVEEREREVLGSVEMGKILELWSKCNCDAIEMGKKRRFV